MTPTAPLGRRAAVEFVGTGALVAVVVGSGVQAAELSPSTPTPGAGVSAWPC
ncbi:hypothetical protein ACFVHB_06585 [Kitasatospora sp. NPDC127111]|uniref:hypothetical protein n=1 Tax=Kitasatospora sp. NPDC127111 TaxID=3345363 RepID=UPI0036378756